MNPLLKYGAAVAVVLGALYGAYRHGISVEQGRQASAELSRQQTKDDMQTVVAEAISNIKVTNTTVRAEVQHEIQTNTIYRDCKLPADGLRIANEALAGRISKPAGGSKLPAANANAGH
jgi:F0F1-type ATP synthase membrane subunit c/vacuolar-type H+-ATPase subunit K